MRQLLKLVCPAALVAMSGCDAGVPREPASVATGLPRLERVEIPALDSIGPERSSASYAVSNTGMLAFTTGFDPGNRVIAIVDTSGKVVRRLATRGPGPGEFESDQYLAMSFSGDTLVAYNIGKSRLLTFSLDDGRLINTTASFVGGPPIRVAADSSDFIVLTFESGARTHGIVRVSTTTGSGRALLAERDSLHDSLRAAHPWAFRLDVPVVSTPDMVVIADPFEYRFQAFDRDAKPIAQWGRFLPPWLRTERVIDSFKVDFQKNGAPGGMPGAPRRARSARELADYERFLRQPLRRFAAIAFDQKERLWVLGRDETGSTFIDIFVAREFRGRLSAPCDDLSTFLPPAISGEFYAVLCRAPERDSGVELRLYRIMS